MCYIRSEPKGYGQGNLVECNPQRNLKAIVIDDLLFTGASLTRSVDVLASKYNIETIGILTIVALSSWESKENDWHFFKERGIKTLSLTSFTHLLDELTHRGKITPDQKKELHSYYLRPKSYEWKWY